MNQPGPAKMIDESSPDASAVEWRQLDLLLPELQKCYDSRNETRRRSSSTEVARRVMEAMKKIEKGEMGESDCSSARSRPWLGTKKRAVCFRPEIKRLEAGWLEAAQAVEQVVRG
jgi:hypothetical protein